MTGAWKSVVGLAAAGCFLLAPGAARGEVTTVCVACAQPDQRYVCQVEAPGAGLGRKAVQLYCIVRTAKDGGHKSCAIVRDPEGPCEGPVRTYRVDRSLIPGPFRPWGAPPPQTAEQPAPATPKDGEPKTLIEMTSRAGEKVRDVAGGTGRTLGNISKKAGEQVGKTAKGAGNVAKKTGSAIGNAAKFTYRCARSLFRECSSDEGADDQ